MGLKEVTWLGALTIADPLLSTWLFTTIEAGQGMGSGCGQLCSGCILILVSMLFVKLGIVMVPAV